ncbi:SsrA-binding protein SmpB [Dissulfurirhabdus thermomarina]|uniref:SsrA-binding protein n=1 Tax=Dissulfurirhabdus thermomarina TaxID=1765737 RepID=A0A6N9TR29_DISTH|nr:SsrA-binding protein SmpB [Dissulfurirhabdus thermomarina]NDY41897.1 SsrA-binding protein SmpB [Dissulfurirhabdus thermomarina]NMX23713.1 SsrA-binding protein SmpB [Dissulfurirhabdus thermomarina]
MAKDHVKIVARNRKARFAYHIEDTLEAGLVLLGPEVKSLREGRANLADGYVVFKRGEAWLQNVHISPYPFAAHHQHLDPLRPRKLLLHRREIDRLAGKVQERGLSLVPLSLYFRDGKAKVELGLARGKKRYDKRETLKRRTEEREIRRRYKIR